MTDIKEEVRKYLELQSYSKSRINEQLTRIDRFPNNPYKKTKFRKAWLITWEGINARIKGFKHLVSVQNPRASSDKIMQYMEQFYIDIYTVFENLIYKSN